MRCCAHILNMIVKDGLSVMDEGIERIHDSVAYWTSTKKEWKILRKLLVNYIFQ